MLKSEEQGVLLNSLAATYKEQNSIFLEQALCVCVCERERERGRGEEGEGGGEGGGVV